VLARIYAFIMAAFTSLALLGPLTPVTDLSAEKKPVFSSSAEVTIMTYNVKVSGVGKYKPAKRAPYVTDNVLKNAPDSIGFEEVSEDWYEWLREGLGEKYAWTGEARNGDGTGEASPVFYNKAKYKCTKSGTFWLSETPDTASKGWDAMYKRVCTYAVLVNKHTGFTYAHFNAHFDHIGIKARSESVALVTKMINEICPGIPVVFSGDLNDDEGSAMYDRIIESGLRDSKFIAGKSEDTGTYHGYSALTEKMRVKPIDFIFFNDYCKKVKSYEVLTEKYNGIYTSDHHPLKVIMTLGNTR